MRKQIYYLISIFCGLSLIITFSIVTKIDNISRLPENINTDYYMNSLPFIYLIFAILIILILTNIIAIVKSKNNSTL